MKSSVVRCADYEAENVRAALTEALAPLGGLDWVQSGMKIAIKTNLVGAYKPEKNATVNPTLLAELTRMLTERGAVVTVGDSPSLPFCRPLLKYIYRKTGVRAVESAGGRLNLNTRHAMAEFPEAVCAKSFECAAWLCEADAVIDVCKLKTHSMMGLSCAVKNFFGTIPGSVKQEYHFRFSTEERFGNMLVDLAEFFAPKLVIADAVVCMEGCGPTHGQPRQVGAILASTSPHALDLMAARIVGYEPRKIPTLKAAIRRRLIPDNVRELDICGDLDSLVQPDYVRVDERAGLQFQAAGRFVAWLLRLIMRSQVRVNEHGCTGCGKCLKSCSEGALSVRQGVAILDRERCIDCLECAGSCPIGALKLHRSGLARLLAGK